MEHVLSLELDVVPDRFDEFIELLRQALVETRAFQGCRSMETYLDRRASRVLILERWESPDAYRNYFRWRTETGFAELIAPFLAAPPRATPWEHAPDV